VSIKTAIRIVRSTCGRRDRNGFVRNWTRRNQLRGWLSK